MSQIIDMRVHLINDKSEYIIRQASDLKPPFLNCFIGWKCQAGIESLYITDEGMLYTATCESIGIHGRKGSIGNIFGKFELPVQAINCARCNCVSEFDLTISKVKRSKYSEILELDKQTSMSRFSLVSDVEAPIALQRYYRPYNKQVLWNLGTTELGKLDRLKAAVENLESFFKGSVGFFIFSGDEATNDPAFLDFIRFIVVDKGHFVSVATKVLQDIDYYVQLVRLSDLKLSMGHNFDYDTFYEYVFAICTEIHRCQSSGKPSHRFDVVLKTSGEDSQMQSLIRRIRDIPYFEATAQLSIQEAERTTIRRESAPVPQTKVAAPRTVAESDGSRVLCFVPMRNCETSIERVVENIKLTVLSKIDEILILDNQSSDQSVMRARDALSTVSQVKTTVRANDTNRGLGGSHKIAFNYAFENGYDYLLVVHGDGSGKLQEFVPVLQQKAFMRHEAVLSSRLSSQKTRTGYPLYRLLGNLFLSGIASLLTRRSVSDFTSGPVNLYRVTSVINKFEKPVLTFDNKVEFPQDILLYLIYRRARFQFIDIDYVEAGGKSAYVAFTQFVRGLQRLFFYRRRYRTKLK